MRRVNSLAINTRLKRMSILTLASPSVRNLPIAVGAIDQPRRQMFVWLAATIFLDPPPVVTNFLRNLRLFIGIGPGI